MDNVELAYIAGYFDGEGSVGIYKSGGGYSIIAQVTNTYKPMIETLYKEFGGNIRSRKSYNGVGFVVARQQWSWSASGKNAASFFNQILPYLHEKRIQAEEAVTFQSLYGKQKGVPRKRTQEQLLDQEARALKVKGLKSVEYKDLQDAVR
jgi:hypothetical protein